VPDGVWKESDAPKSVAVTSPYPMSGPIAAIAVTAMLAGCANAPTEAVPSLDTTPPPAPANLSASRDSFDHQILTWEPSAAADVTGYQVYVYSPSPERDNAYLLVDDPDSGDNSYQLPSVTVATEAFYRVRALDASGNRSAFSAAAPVTITPSASGGAGGRKPTNPPEGGGG
jgi:hypothetical protein